MTDRIPMTESRRPRPDWWARLFAVGGLAAGTAALYYSWVHTANLPSTQDIVSSYRAEVDEVLVAAKANLKEQDRLEAIARKQRNDSEWQAIQERDTRFEQRLATLTAGDTSAAEKLTAAAGEESTSDTDAGVPEAGVPEAGIPEAGIPEAGDTATTDGAPTTNVSDGDPSFEDLFGLEDSAPSGEVATVDDARLLVARRALRPSSAADAEIATISNPTKFDLRISAIEFVPNSLYEANSVLRSDATSMGTGDLDIQLTRTDNQARDPDKQGTYGHQFTDAITVAAGSQPNLRVQIQNGQHLGWGLRGTLVLTYGDQQLEIPSVSARFVAEPE